MSALTATWGSHHHLSPAPAFCLSAEWLEGILFCVLFFYTLRSMAFTFLEL